MADSTLPIGSAIDLTPRVRCTERGSNMLYRAKPILQSKSIRSGEVLFDRWGRQPEPQCFYIGRDMHSSIIGQLRISSRSHQTANSTAARA